MFYDYKEDEKSLIDKAEEQCLKLQPEEKRNPLNENDPLRSAQRVVVEEGERILIAELKAKRGESNPAADRLSDPINPNHYRQHPSGVECIQIIEHFPHNVAAAIGYLWRAGKKTADPTEDFKKAIWHIEREIKRVGAGK